jgi:ABC-type cobalamin/Fe3+-siderophores transport system ATPase subunit
VLALENGAVAAEGPAREVLTADLIRRLYRVDTAFWDTPQGPMILPEVKL